MKNACKAIGCIILILTLLCACSTKQLTLKSEYASAVSTEQCELMGEYISLYREAFSNAKDENDIFTMISDDIQGAYDKLDLNMEYIPDDTIITPLKWDLLSIGYLYTMITVAQQEDTLAHAVGYNDTSPIKLLADHLEIPDEENEAKLQQLVINTIGERLDSVIASYFE